MRVLDSGALVIEGRKIAEPAPEYLELPVPFAWNFSRKPRSQRGYVKPGTD
jgi:hypothetical protein